MLQAKKIFLSAAVILTFIAYSFQQRGESGQAGSIVAANPPTTTSPLASSKLKTGGEDDGAGKVQTNSSASAPKSQPTTQGAGYKDGSYTGSQGDAYYGYVQVQVIISGGNITDVQFLSHPSDNPTSNYINSQAMPLLKQEAITAQSASVSGVTGATDTSIAFAQSLQSALSQAH